MDFETAIHAVGRAKDNVSLSKLLVEWRELSGLNHIAYLAFRITAYPEHAPIWLGTYPDAWSDFYLTNGWFRADPVLVAARDTCTLIDWMAVDRSSAEAQRFFSKAEHHGIGRHGLTLPIRGPFGERALFTVNTNDTDHHWHRWRASYARDFYLIAAYFHERVMQIANLRTFPETMALSARGRLCLEQIASGRTPQQIAGNLDITVGAVHQYLRSARQKLACATLEEAVAKAIWLDVIAYGIRSAP